MFFVVNYDYICSKINLKHMSITNYVNTCMVFEGKLSCFNELTPKQHELIEANKVDITYKKGETICKQGSFASHVIFLKEGLVKVYLEGKPRNLILNIMPSNNLIGLPSIIEGNSTFLYTASTYTESTVSLIELSLFKQLLNKNAAFSAKIINVLNENTLQIYGRFFSLTRKQMHGRMADILLCLSQRVFQNESFDLALSRSDLAELTGMSNESVIRILKEFKTDKLISEKGKTFEILDFKTLSKISELG
jgi:CRP/FNR family transcriptional regulator, polysaccharide utilization system transcription regulator